MNRLRLPPRNLLVFALRGQDKFKGFYTPQKNSYADYYDLVKVWVADMSLDCTVIRQGVGLGSLCYIRDVFELEPLPPSVVEAYVERIDFKDEVLSELDITGGSVVANVIHEDSLLGVEEDRCQKNPKLSWDPPGSANLH